MSSTFSTRITLVLLSFPLLLAARCENAYESMGADGGTESEPEPEPEAGRATGGSSGKNSEPSAGTMSVEPSAGTGGRATGGTRGEPEPEGGSVGNEPSGGRATLGGTGGTGGTPAFDCAAFKDAEPAGPVTVRVVNDGAEPIYLGRPETSCGGPGERFSLRDAAGNRLQHQGEYCEPSCETQQLDIIGCPAICLYQQVVRIEPGGSFETPWHTLLIREAAMPATCYGRHIEPAPTCRMATPAPEGDYEVSVVAWSDGGCSGGGLCDCQGDARSCTFTGPSITQGTSRTGRSTLSYPAQNLVEIHFE